MSNWAETTRTSTTERTSLCTKRSSSTQLFTRDNPPPPPPRSSNTRQYSQLWPPPPPPRPHSLNSNLNFRRSSSRESTGHRQGRLSWSQAQLSASERTDQGDRRRRISFQNDVNSHSFPSRSIISNSDRYGRRASFDGDLLTGNRREKGASHHNAPSSYCVGNTSSESSMLGKRNTGFISRSPSASSLPKLMATQRSASSQPILDAESKAKDDQQWLEILAATEGKSTNNNTRSHQGASNEIANVNSPNEKGSYYYPTSSSASTSHSKQHELRDKKSYKERVSSSTKEIKNKILSTIRLIQEAQAKDDYKEKTSSKQNFDKDGRCRRHPRIIVAKKRPFAKVSFN